MAYTILIDPGHGGEELGAVSYQMKKGKRIKVYEKNLSLTLAKKIKKKLGTKYNVYLTRSIDRKVELEERAELAEKLKADLFISIHFNSSENSRHNGFETYYLDNHANAAVKKVETIENRDMHGNEQELSKILIDLVVQKTVKFSRSLSNFIHRNINKNIKKKFRMKDRGMKPGLFYVLALSKRPGVLLEAGFLSNSKEAKKISSSRYLDRYATSVVKGINEYTNKNYSLASAPLF